MDVSDVIEEIYTARGAICGLSSSSSPSLSALAVELGLAGDTTLYREIDADLARQIVQLILNQDLAYGATIISDGRATELAEHFLAHFGSNGVRFFTNGYFQTSQAGKFSLSGWKPVTSATFDTGVLVIGPHCAGCLWVEDED